MSETTTTEPPSLPGEYLRYTNGTGGIEAVAIETTETMNIARSWRWNRFTAKWYRNPAGDTVARQLVLAHDLAKRAEVAEARLRRLDKLLQRYPKILLSTALPRSHKDEPEHCHADDDGHCTRKGCPQNRDGEPKKSGRHCPLDRDEDR